ncbi:unnamed protein product [Periconia digitata]|uniref:DDHD domain-containing protein n=1 Tax=Periconia digitata TaxID=1303443 RepID=A0A9W4UE11_9PLEO|nr:unnamed protein product [Periconia digitata]
MTPHPFNNPSSSSPSKPNVYTRQLPHDDSHSSDSPPPAINVRYFYTSPLAIDDPLSPLPPPATGAATAAARKQAPRPFSAFDNDAISKTWAELRREILRFNEDIGEKNAGGNGSGRAEGVKGGGEGQRQTVRTGLENDDNEGRSSSLARDIPMAAKPSGDGGESLSSERGFGGSGSLREGGGRGRRPMARLGDRDGERNSPSQARDIPLAAKSTSDGLSSLSAERGTASSLRFMEPKDGSPISGPAITGTPFIRAPSRSDPSHFRRSTRRPDPAPLHEADSYLWDEDMKPVLPGLKGKGPVQVPSTPKPGPTAKVPVGVSRLHHVVLDTESVRMEPIYWKPVNDIAAVLRGTWFYKDTMLPVEVEVANMLEVGYLELRPWTETWRDELNSAIEVGALGEMKILHKLWPERPIKVESRPSSSQQMSSGGTMQNTLPEEPIDPETERANIVEAACDLIDIATGPDGPDNKSAGDSEYGRAGRKNLYRSAGVIYANDTDAYILRPSLQPSNYYGRRPLANYIRKGRTIGLHVVRGFDQTIWDKLHPVKKTPMAQMAREGVSTAQAGIPPNRRQKSDPALAQSQRPQVTDLVLVIHGIGQKLSERMETFHFTHAINAFRREVNVELGTNDVKRNLRRDMGGIMVLPVNWRIGMSLEDDPGGLAGSQEDDPSVNKYTLKDITPDTLPSVRGIVSDVMLDVPYYLSPEHHPKMVSACINEANRIYRLWCQNNPGFSEWGRVHLVAHSLGSVMAMDILSTQPSEVDPALGDPSLPTSDLPTDHFIFNTKSLFVCGSPVGFFLLLRNATLRPRHDKDKPGADLSSARTPGVAGTRGDFGCIAVDNIYNIVNGYDPVAYRLNAAIDVAYAASLKPAVIPSANTSLFSFVNPFRTSSSTSPSSSAAAASSSAKPPTARLPSNVELETHDFSREEIAEKRAHLLNDNGQVDYFLKYGGGALEIQYLTMLGAHSSYWISRDFVRMIVLEVGRVVGRDGVLEGMKAVKMGVKGRS